MERFLKIIADTMDVNENEISLKTRYKEYSKWDSLMMMNLIIELEDSYDIVILIEDISNVKTLEDLYQLTITKR